MPVIAAPNSAVRDAHIPGVEYVQPDVKLIAVFRNQGDCYPRIVDGLMTERIEPNFLSLPLELGELGAEADTNAVIAVIATYWPSTILLDGRR